MSRSGRNRHVWSPGHERSFRSANSEDVRGVLHCSSCCVHWPHEITKECTLKSTETVHLVVKLQSSNKKDNVLQGHPRVGRWGHARHSYCVHRIEQNMLPPWQTLSTVALILVVTEMPSLEGYRERGRPDGELASGRGGGFSKTQGGADLQLRNARKRQKPNKQIYAEHGQIIF